MDYGPGSTLGVLAGLVISYQTDRAGGFDEAELGLLRRPAFALARKAIASVHTGRALLATYLGADPARRVLEGAIVRGKAEPVRPCSNSDLQGVTRIADTAPGTSSWVCSTSTPTAWSAPSARARGRGAEVHRRRHPGHVPARREPLRPGARRGRGRGPPTSTG